MNELLAELKKINARLAVIEEAISGGSAPFVSSADVSPSELARLIGKYGKQAVKDFNARQGGRK